MFALAVFLGGCGGSDFVGQTETQRITGFDEKASYYDALAKGDIEVEVETTSLSHDVAFEGEKKLLPNGAADKLEYINNCMNKTLQDGSFDKSFWKNETGMSLEQLWSLYQKT